MSKPVNPISLGGFHHVAYRCVDAKETVEFYQKYLNMEFQLAIAEDEVPSTGEPDPYMHVFLDAGGGNVLAFFELPNSKPLGCDPNTPQWVQHIAIKVDNIEALHQAKHFLEDNGIDVLGPVDHGIFHSVYFFDPNGHRLELTADVSDSLTLHKLKDVAPDMLEEWSRTKRAPRHAAWLHQK